MLNSETKKNSELLIPEREKNLEIPITEKLITELKVLEKHFPNNSKGECQHTFPYKGWRGGAFLLCILR